MQTNEPERYRECLALMETLMHYRQEPIHRRLSSVRDKISMLHLDVLLLVYHFARLSRGAILEIGSFLGAATIAAAFGLRDRESRKPLITIEPGGGVEHPSLGTRNILRRLERNLRKYGVSDVVTLLKGRSFDPAIRAAVREKLGPEQIGLLVIDADAQVQRDLNLYRDLLAADSWLVIDDYFGPPSNEKFQSTRVQVDALVESGAAVTLGFYGWGTWVGRWQGGLTPLPGQ